MTSRRVVSGNCLPVGIHRMNLASTGMYHQPYKVFMGLPLRGESSMRIATFLGRPTMPFRTHPEFAKMVSALTEPTCAACILKDSDITNKEVLIEEVERMASQGRCLANGLCRVCREFKLVITPA
jgi:hypothetical protein